MSVVLLVVRVLIILLLYTFIGWVVYTLWIDHYRTKSENISQGIPSLELILRSSGFSGRIEIKTSKAVIGRDPGSDVQIDDSAISSQHAMLTYHNNQWWVEDLSSTNGTFLNGDRLKQPAMLIHEDKISCGNSELEVHIPQQSGGLNE